MRFKHGFAFHGKIKPEYSAWDHMKQRCLNSRHKHFHHYGGRGITVCERWLKFENFIADMGERPTSKHTLDRVDNNGNYEPSNCRWATRKEQSANTRRKKFLTVGGVTKRIFEWCEETGFKRNLIESRIRLGWTPERAVTVPPGQPKIPKIRPPREPKPIKPKRRRDQERYQDFLREDGSLRFGEWLKARKIREQMRGL